MAQFFENAVFGFCWWDIPALILLLGVAAFFAMKKHNLKKEKENLKNQLPN